MYTYSYKIGLDENLHPVLLKEKRYQVQYLNNVNTLVELFRETIPIISYAQETVYIIPVNKKLRPLAILQTALGTADMALCSPREILISCLLTGATGFFVVHNHPTGICHPSGEDIRLAERLKKAGELVDINMIDFMIVGREGYYSYKENDKLH